MKVHKELIDYGDFGACLPIDSICCQLRVIRVKPQTFNVIQTTLDNSKVTCKKCLRIIKKQEDSHV
jgi:hypothetical protein